MKLRTLVPVTYNVGIASQETGIVYGVLTLCTQMMKADNFSFNYRYEPESGSQIINSNGYFSMTGEEVNQLYELIKGQITIDVPYTEKVKQIYYLGMRVEMAKTFGISVNDMR